MPTELKMELYQFLNLKIELLRLLIGLKFNQWIIKLEKIRDKMVDLYKTGLHLFKILLKLLFQEIKQNQAWTTILNLRDPLTDLFLWLLKTRPFLKTGKILQFLNKEIIKPCLNQILDLLNLLQDLLKSILVLKQNKLMLLIYLQKRLSTLALQINVFKPWIKLLNRTKKFASGMKLQEIMWFVMQKTTQANVEEISVQMLTLILQDTLCVLHLLFVALQLFSWRSMQICLLSLPILSKCVSIRSISTKLIL